MKRTDIATKPDSDDWCSVCHDEDNVVVSIKGSEGFYYSDMQINLCSDCFAIMNENIKEMEI